MTARSQHAVAAEGMLLRATILTKHAWAAHLAVQSHGWGFPALARGGGQ
ncbi:hypothetical protein [Mycobacterium asiaticum]|nr:hypothetical protein [Mycobacterium asiaticum]